MSALEMFSIKGKLIVLTGGSGLYGRGLAAMLASAAAPMCGNGAVNSRGARPELRRLRRLFPY